MSLVHQQSMSFSRACFELAAGLQLQQTERNVPPASSSSAAPSSSFSGAACSSKGKPVLADAAVLLSKTVRTCSIRKRGQPCLVDTMQSGRLTQLTPLIACVQQQSDAPEELASSLSRAVSTRSLMASLGVGAAVEPPVCPEPALPETAIWRTLKLALYAHIKQPILKCCKSQAEICSKQEQAHISGKVSGFRSWFQTHPRRKAKLKPRGRAESLRRMKSD